MVRSIAHGYEVDIVSHFTIFRVSRASLALSLARIFPEKHRCRRFALALTGTFLVIWIACLFMAAFECYDASTDEWWNVPLPLCVAKRPSVKGAIYVVMACK